MTYEVQGKESKLLDIFTHRNKLLSSLHTHSLQRPAKQSKTFIFQKCCNAISSVIPDCSAWGGEISQEGSILQPIASDPADTAPGKDLLLHLTHILTNKFGPSLEHFTERVALTLELSLSSTAQPHCIIWPVRYRETLFGLLVLQGRESHDLLPPLNEFLASVTDDISQALHGLDITVKLNEERDFNKELIDSIEVLMVTIRPCGSIISINDRVEQITGYSSTEIVGKYWVDVLATPCNRVEFQQLFSQTLKGATTNINFTAPLLTRDQKERFINWHGSIRHNIDHGTIGLVLLGIDETDNLAADQKLNMLTARWQKIFVAIQDPVLVVANDSTILDANPATFAAARKKREEVIGGSVCDILHGGHANAHPCPLEQCIGHQRTQITETELHGLHGMYMLTVSPLLEENGEINATLLVARNLTQEEVIRAEAIRTAQLAALGELASGVAHEINNPINGIINYAQIILDDPADSETADNLRNILSEGKRIAAIVTNLLDFARCREDAFKISHIEKIVSSSMQLVSHLLKKDGINCEVTVKRSLPSMKCNDQQLQQVILNLISNARYALNARHPLPCPEKKIEILADRTQADGTDYITLDVVDYGIGIPSDIRNRLFDPFFSTKPKGEGTGLGLSISHGLIRDHGGKITVQSKPGKWTRFTLYLPVQHAY